MKIINSATMAAVSFVFLMSFSLQGSLSGWMLTPEQREKEREKARVCRLLNEQACKMGVTNVPPLVFEKALIQGVVAQYRVKDSYNLYPSSSSEHCIFVDHTKLSKYDDEQVSFILGHELTHSKEKHQQCISYSPIIFFGAGLASGLVQKSPKPVSSAMAGLLSALLGPRVLEHISEYRASAVSAQNNNCWDKAIEFYRHYAPQQSCGRLKNFCISDQPLLRDQATVLAAMKRLNEIGANL